MEKRVLLFTYIEPEFQAQGIKWLMLSSPIYQADSGFFVFLFEDISLGHKYDDWFENLDLAFSWANEVYQIKKEDWITLNTLEMRGIKVDRMELE